MKFRELRNVLYHGDFDGDPYPVYVFIDGDIAETTSDSFLLGYVDNCTVKRIWPFEGLDGAWLRVDLELPTKPDA